MRPLIIIRPEPGASRTAEHARAMGLDVRKIPLFEVVPLAWTAPDPRDFDGLIMTSANAARLGGGELDKLKALPVHAVGESTAAAARDAGFTVATVGEGGARDMALPQGQRLLHLAGRDHRPTTAVSAIPVYEARPIAHPAGVSDLADCVVAVHSRRAGRRLAELVDASDRSGTAIAAISPAAAEACGSGWERVEASSQPGDEPLLVLAARLCERRDG